MTFYLCNFALNMFSGIAILSFGSNKRKDQRIKFYLLLSVIQMALISGFRSTSVGYDTSNYYIIFSRASGTFETMFDNPLSFVEPGFMVLCSIIKLLGGNFQTLLLITSFFIIGSAAVFVYRHSNNVIFSIFILYCFPFYYSSFDIIRHFCALSFFLLAYQYVEKRKFVPYVILLLIGATFQTIALLFIPYYFLYIVKWNKYTFAIFTVSTIAATLFIQKIANILSNLLGKNSHTDWIDSYGGGIKTALMYFAIFIIAVLAYYNSREHSPKDNISLLNVLLLLSFSIVFINARIMTRMIMSAIPLLSIAIPQLLSCKEGDLSHKKYRNVFLLRCAFVLISLGYHAFLLSMNWQNIIPYVPYWR